jgi:nitrite reductase (NO-forming)
MRKSVIAVLALAALLFAGVAAAQSNSSSTPPAGSAACASPMASPASSPMAGMTETATMAASSPAAGTATAENGCGGTTVEMVDIAFQPTEFTIPANQDVTVTLHNSGAALHNFSVTDHNNPNVKNLNISVDVNPGETKTVTINAPAGDYYFYCNVPGHEAAGMHGTMHVK